MRRNVLLTGSLVAMLAACDTATYPVTVEQTASFDLPETRATTGSGELVPVTFSVKQVSRGVSFPIGWCDEAAGVARVAAPGTGTGTHVGRFEVSQTMCVNTVTGALTDGVATLTTANGDKIYYTFEGEAVPGAMPPKHHLKYTGVGGTGRFASAEGAMDCWPVHITPTDWEDTGTGWLRYAPSDRSEQ